LDLSIQAERKSRPQPWFRYASLLNLKDLPKDGSEGEACTSGEASIFSEGSSWKDYFLGNA